MINFLSVYVRLSYQKLNISFWLQGKAMLRQQRMTSSRPMCRSAMSALDWESSLDGSCTNGGLADLIECPHDVCFLHGGSKGTDMSERLLRKKSFKYKCNECGKYHEGSPSFSLKYPPPYFFDVPETERSDRVQFSDDL